MTDIIDSRLKAILGFMAASDGLVTVDRIAQEIGVSRRTILRDLPEVETWLADRGFVLYKKPGTGMSLHGDEAVREKLSALLGQQRPEIVNLPQERRKMILVELLQRKEPTKLLLFTQRFGVSSSTVSHDLDAVEDWLGHYSLNLIRKPGMGIQVEGREQDFRRAVISLLYDNLSESELLKILKDNVPGKSPVTGAKFEVSLKSRLLNLIDRESIEKIEIIVNQLEERIHYKLAESASVGLMVHLALAIQRLKNNEKITFDPTRLDELRRIKEFVFARQLADKAAEAFQIDVPDDEVGYITMHLKGARIYSTLDARQVTDNELSGLAREMIAVASKASGVSLEDNDKLLRDLISHLETTVSRLRMNLDIRNPLLEKLKALFPEVFAVSCRSAEVLSHWLGLPVPESEIGYLAMHFGAAIERDKTRDRQQTRIIVGCPSGMGSSRLLSARIEKEFKDLVVVDVLATPDITETYLEEARIDLVVTTIPVSGQGIHSVCVNPLLMDEDIQKIRKALGRPVQPESHNSLGKGTHSAVTQSVAGVADLSKMIAEVLDTLEVRQTDVSGCARGEEVLAAVLDTLREEEAQALAEQAVPVIMNLLNDSVVLQAVPVSGDDQARLIFRKLTGNPAYKAKALGMLFVPVAVAGKRPEMVMAMTRFLSENPDIVRAFRLEGTEEISGKIFDAIYQYYMSQMAGWKPAAQRTGS